MVRINRSHDIKILKTIFFFCFAIFLACASDLTFGAEAADTGIAALYKEASMRWSARQAATVPQTLTPEVIKEFSGLYGEKQSKFLAEKSEKVAGLMGRYRLCRLTGEDVSAADKYLTDEFRAEIKYFAEYGCRSQAKTARSNATPAVVARLESLSQEELLSYSGGTSLFDGAAKNSGTVEPVAYNSQGTPNTKTIVPAVWPVTTTRAVQVPALKRTEKPQISDRANEGKVGYAVEYWEQVRAENLLILKLSDADRSEKMKAGIKFSAAFAFGGILQLSSLPSVEHASVRLKSDIREDAGAVVVAIDSGKLAFHSVVCLLSFLPIPIGKVVKAAAAGEAWAIALVASFGIGPINSYILHLVD